MNLSILENTKSGAKFHLLTFAGSWKEIHFSYLKQQTWIESDKKSIAIIYAKILS